MTTFEGECKHFQKFGDLGVARSQTKHFFVIGGHSIQILFVRSRSFLCQTQSESDLRPLAPVCESLGRSIETREDFRFVI